MFYFLVAQQLYISLRFFVFVCLFVCESPKWIDWTKPFQTKLKSAHQKQTKLDQMKPNWPNQTRYGQIVVLRAAQLLYGPVLVEILSANVTQWEGYQVL